MTQPHYLQHKTLTILAILVAYNNAIFHTIVSFLEIKRTMKIDVMFNYLVRLFI